MYGNVRGQIDNSIYVALRDHNVDVPKGTLLIKSRHTGDCHYAFTPVHLAHGWLLPELDRELPREVSGYEEQEISELLQADYRLLLAGMPVHLSVSETQVLTAALDAVRAELAKSQAKAAEVDVLQTQLLDKFKNSKKNERIYVSRRDIPDVIIGWLVDIEDELLEGGGKRALGTICDNESDERDAREIPLSKIQLWKWKAPGQSTDEPLLSKEEAERALAFVRPKSASAKKMTKTVKPKSERIDPKLMCKKGGK